MAHSKARTILVVASDPAQGAWLRDLLQGAGFGVVSSAEAGEALAALENSRPDLVIAGLSSARLEGWTLCRLLHPPDPAELDAAPPVLVLSQHLVGEEAARITAELGGAGLLPYPIRREDLLSAIDSQLNRAAAAAAGLESREFQSGENRFHRAVKDAGAGYFFVDTEGRFRWVNDAWLRLHGYASLDEVVGQPFAITQTERDLERADEIVRGLLGGTAVPAGEFSRRRKDGSVGYHIFSAHPVMDGGRVIGLEGFLIDTTATHEAEERYQMLFERMLDGFALHEMIFDAAGRPADYRFLAVNPAFEAATGLKARDILGKTALEVVPDLERVWIENYGRVVLTGIPFRFESRQAGMGKDFDVVAYRPQPGRFACIFRDVTRQKADEEEIRRLVYLHEVLSQVNQAIVRASSREELFDIVCRVANRYGHFRATWIGVPDDAGMRLAAGESADPGRVFPTLAAYCTVSRDAVASGRPVICGAMSPDPSGPECHSKAVEWGVGSCAAFPICLHGKVFGSLCVHAAEAGFFRDAEVALLMEVAADISFALDKIEADKARREVEERFAVAFEHFPAAACISTIEDGTCLQVNRQFEAVFGFSRQELVGSTLADLGMMSPELREHVAEIFHREGRVSGVEFALRAKDGRMVDCLSTVERICVGGQDRILTMLLDITERKRMDEKLRQSEERLRLTLEATNTVAWGISAGDGSIHEAGPVGRLFGRSKGFAHAGPNDFASTIHPADRDRVLEASALALRGEGEFRVEYRVPLPDGGEKWIAAHATLLRDAEGKPERLLGVATDCTDRKRAEIRLRESQTELAAAQRIARIGSWQWDVRTDRAHWSEETFRIFERPPGPLEQHGARFPELVHPDDRERVARALMAALDGTADYDLEYRVLLANGAEKVIHAQAEVLRDESGTPAVMRGTVHDITERKHAEKALRESEERLRAITESARDAIVMVDTGGCISFWNAAAERIFGYTWEEAAGRNLHQILAPERYREAYEAAFRGFIKTGQGRAVEGTVEFQARCKDGEEIPVELSLSALRREGGWYAVGVVRDIAERKRAQEDLATSNLRLNLVVAAGRLGIWEWDIQTGTQDWDDRMYELYGIPRGQGAVTCEMWRDAVHPDDQDRIIAAAEDAVRDGRQLDVDFRVVRPDGSVRYIKSDGILVRDAEGRSVRMVGMNRDLTDRRRAAEETARLEAELAQSQKMESIGRLAGGVAHDFNNLLTVINGYSGLALAELKSGDPLRSHVEEILSAGERAAGLTRQLLAFSRKQVLQPRVLDLNRVVTEMRSMLVRLMGEDVEVRFALDHRGPMVHADPHQLEQVIMNLAVNARDAMPRGGRLVVETGLVEWDAGYASLHPEARAGRYAMLSVGDTGVGMAEATRQRIFEPFFTTKGTGRGTGLGLSMVQGIVAQSGGHIDVDSEVDRGSTFRIYLPLLTDATVEAEKPVAASALRGSENILVVEDQESVRNFAVRVLEAYGYHVIQAASAGEALGICEGEMAHIHLVLTDVVMPQTSGPELVARLVETRPGIKALFMSGYTDDVIVHHGVLDQSAAFIEKPFSPEQLAAKVRAVLGAPAAAVRIVVADDEPGVRSFLRSVLKANGYEVTEAGDGKEALHEALAMKADLVITDLVMPEQEGIETIRALRRDAPGIGIIAISGAFGGQFLKIARGLGADAVLNKPVTPEALLAAVAQILALRPPSRPRPGAA